MGTIPEPPACDRVAVSGSVASGLRWCRRIQIRTLGLGAAARLLIELAVGRLGDLGQRRRRRNQFLDQEAASQLRALGAVLACGIGDVLCDVVVGRGHPDARDVNCERWLSRSQE